MSKSSVFLGILALLSASVFVADVYLLPANFMPAVVYVVPIILCAYFMPRPRWVAGIALWTLGLQSLAYWIQEPRPALLPASYVMGLGLMSFLFVVLAQRANKEAELRQIAQEGEQRYRSLTQQLQAQSEELQSQAEQLRSQYEELVTRERELRESEERLKRAQEIAHLGSWELDLVHNRLTWSDEVYRIFGLRPQEFGATYEAFLERVHPDDRAAVDAAYTGSLRENRDTYEIEHRVVRKSTGEIRFVHEKCEHFRDATGRIIRSVGMVHDITERKQAEAERERLLASEHEARSLAEAAVKVRDEFMSIAAHELKTPVTSLQGYAQLMLRELGKTGSVDPVRLARSMERIEQQSRRLTKLTDQLLNVSRLQSGKLTLFREETVLCSLVGRIVGDTIHSHPQRLVQFCDRGGGEAYIDPMRIEQVLVNLIDNAIKFSPADSRVEVDLDKESLVGWN